MKGSVLAVFAVLCLLGVTSAQSTTYNLTLTGAANSPPINDAAVGQAYLAISFNSDANNITYQLFADSITEPLAAHIHISPSVGANGSVSIPLFQAPFVNLPGAMTTGLLAGNALMPTAFVGPYLEVLPNYDNVPVSQVLSQYVQTGLAYAQVHTMQYPYGALKATFDNTTIISEVVPAIYGASLVTPTGQFQAVVPFAPTTVVDALNATMAQDNMTGDMSG